MLTTLVGFAGAASALVAFLSSIFLFQIKGLSG